MSIQMQDASIGTQEKQFGEKKVQSGLLKCPLCQAYVELPFKYFCNQCIVNRKKYLQSIKHPHYQKISSPHRPQLFKQQQLYYPQFRYQPIQNQFIPRNNNQYRYQHYMSNHNHLFQRQQFKHQKDFNLNERKQVKKNRLNSCSPNRSRKRIRSVQRFQPIAY